ncbi:UDP-N-acetylmuramate dehydrogenase [Candidatus Saccharibacteria bacterium]|nr:UDP-N-acetylmuramate dehydrogenase [Candidatus Saccharibacteria bacterium]MCA9337468.1 UDP-N-acetylmuramate dehydrogenase [Candidatus Saccharibacteria bacterium]
MQIHKNVSLADYTTFGTGGDAQVLITIEQTPELTTALHTHDSPLWFLGSGANVLVSDEGLPGTTIRLATSNIEIKETLFVADAGVNWDDLVQKTIKHQLWGLESMSGIPGSVGAAVVGNIAAYGQAVSDSLEWVEVIDTNTTTPETICMTADELELGYRYSKFQQPKNSHLIITRAAFRLTKKPRPLEYASALKVADELALDPDELESRRKIIMEARRRAGSLISSGADNTKTAGSFFRNPSVTPAQAELIMQFEEQSIPLEQIKAQNAVHGGDSTRVSAAHVLLAAGFKRGQSWGPVRLHPQHILKIENTGGATSQQIYEVAQEIIQTVESKLGIKLEPEVRFLGDFN